ncbi:MAG: TlpA disulfide reductase family protein [Desulfobacterales bacterium]|jgi:peroxiredoxin
MKKGPFKTALLFIILVAIAGFALHLFYNGYVATAGSQQQELDRLFGNMGILKIPHVTLPVEIQLKDPYGNWIRLSDYRGKVVFLNFWATWCAACVVEMPAMEKLHRRLKDKDFMMVAINMQESDAQVKAFFEKLKLSFTTLLDSSGEVAAGFAVNALPTTFVLDKEGRIVGAAIGPREWDSRASMALFDYLMNMRSASG